jgi:hypothetical protein
MINGERNEETRAGRLGAWGNERMILMGREKSSNRYDL